jgi:uncharacterized membrane protein
MKYESEFRIKEKEFRPRKDFKHQQVVDELANIVKRADIEIEELVKKVDSEMNEIEEHIDEIIGINDKLLKESKENERFTLYITVIAVLSLTINILQTL